MISLTKFKGLEIYKTKQSHVKGGCCEPPPPPPDPDKSQAAASQAAVGG